MSYLRSLLVFATVILSGSVAFSAVPYMISYQGRLTNSSGVALPEGTHVAVTFSIYDALTFGTAIWTELDSVTVGKDGQFRVFLGSATPLTDAVFSGSDRFLGMAVNFDPEMSPRVRLVSSPYSIRIGSVDGAKGGSISSPVAIGSIPLKSQLTLGGGLDLPYTTSFPEDNTSGIRWMNGFDAHTAFGLFVNSGLWFQGDGNLANSSFGVRRPNSEGALGDISFVVNASGNVGVGTASPGTRLHVSGRTLYNQGYSYGICVSDSTDPSKRLNLGFDASLNAGVIQASHDFVSWNRNLLLNPNAGNVGIGTTNPEQTLHVHKGSAGAVTSDVNSIAVLENSTHGYLSILAPSGSERGVLFGDNQHPEDGGIVYVGASNRLDFRTNGNSTRLTIDAAGKVGIGTTLPSQELDVIGRIQCQKLTATTDVACNGNAVVAGRTRTGTLEITGGADLAEPFSIASPEAISAGAVVVIDEEHPGQLKLSNVSYDGRVAGVISGAGGINPGLTLMQEGTLDVGQNVALSGRVYVLATAANGSIKPGDLLTTSDLPGHAMKASDRERSQGAVLGKAMSRLDTGEGLILVLVNLQ